MMMQGKGGNWYHVPDQIFGDRDGRTFSPALDRLSLDTQAGLTFIFMSTHEWVTPEEVIEGIGWVHSSTASVTARFRDFRKPKFGGYVVLRRRRAGSRRLHEYMLMPPEEPCLDTPASPTSTPPVVSTVVSPPSRPPSTTGWRIVPSSP
jgi:hypothetical protein